MLTFSFGALGDATISGTDITKTVPYGTNVTALSPTYTMNGVSCSPLSPPVTPLDFTNPVPYTVTAADNSTQVYTVTVTVTPASSAKDILTFGLPGMPAAIDQVAKTVTCDVPYGTNLATLAPAYTVSPFATGSPATATAPDFVTNNPATYTITAQNGSTQNYLVTVTVSPASAAKDILTFGLPGMAAAIDQVAKTVTWYVPYGTNLTTLAPAYTVSPFANGSPATATAPDFGTTNPATYTITAQNGSTQPYLVTVIVLPNVTSNSYNEWTTVPNNTDGDVALNKTVTLCDGSLQSDSQPVSALTDGLWQTSSDNAGRSVFGAFGAGKNYRVSIDLTQAYSISEIDAWSWHNGVRAPQEYDVWGAASPTATGTDLTYASYAFGVGLSSAGYTLIGHVATSTASGKWTTQFTGSIGSYRYLVFDIPPAPGPTGAGTFFGEIAVKGTLVTTGLFASWITAYYATPSDPNAAPDADPDGDGFKNSVEYVLGSLPNTSNPGGPGAATAGGNLVFTFQRALASKNPDTKVAIEVSTDLGVWIAYDVDTAPEVAISAGLDADHETVTLTLPMTPDTTKFARLRVAVTAAP
jgi:hypothetical protein